MNVLPKYFATDLARFDFRIPDGLGNYVYPDWDDPGLKVEFYDSEGTLRFTATRYTDPPIERDNDYNVDAEPDGGPYIDIDGIELESFALGVAEAKVYARVDGAQVLPYPTALSAFEVVADVPEGNMYTTVSRVKDQVPGDWPHEVTDRMVMIAVSDASRKIDAFLHTCYDTPFYDIGGDPPTPPVLESVCRRMAACQCLEWMGRLNSASEADLRGRAESLLMRMVPSDGKTPMVRLPGYKGPVPLYVGEMAVADETASNIADGG